MKSHTVERMAAAGMLALALVACSGGGGGGEGGTGSAPPASPAPTNPTPTPTPAPTPTSPAPSTPVPTGPSATVLDTQGEASSFLARASFGGTLAQMEALEGTQASAWVAREFEKPASLLLPELLARQAAGEGLVRRYLSVNTWNLMVGADDQLRQRMVFALSQLFPINEGFQAERNVYFHDILARNAFGNYRTLLGEVTYSPRMARSLTYFRNEKGDPATGRMPDENYAREVMQLFTIGLVELNMDGTPKLGGDGQPIETYDDGDVLGLARVFTGLSTKGSGFRNPDDGSDYAPLQMFDEFHSPLEKTFLGTTIPAGTSGEQSVDRALDHLFAHPNVAPFISRQLIQRFTASSPEPAYVERVATAFETGQFTSTDGTVFGTGERGDLQATLAAILLDPVLFIDGEPSIRAGKIREPVLRWVHWARAFRAAPIDSENEGKLARTFDPFESLGQQPYRSPSIFNFYRPGYIAPGSASGAQGLTGPEFQIVNENSTVGYLNFMTEYIQNDTSRSSDPDLFIPDYSQELALADDPGALVAHLDVLLTGGKMLAETRREIEETIALIEISPDTASADRLTRVELAILMAVNAPSYGIQR